MIKAEELLNHLETAKPAELNALMASVAAHVGLTLKALELREGRWYAEVVTIRKYEHGIVVDEQTIWRPVSDLLKNRHNEQHAQG